MEKVKSDKELQKWFLKFCKENKGCYIMTEEEYNSYISKSKFDEVLGNAELQLPSERITKRTDRDI